MPANEIEYRGQRIKLTKAYDSYEDYKDDPDNIDPSENARVAHLVETAPVNSTYSGRSEFIHETSALGFPGYGMGWSGENEQPDGSSHELVSIEIPRANRTRYLFFIARNSIYSLQEDFIRDGYFTILSGTAKDGQITYYDNKKAVVCVHKLKSS